MDRLSCGVIFLGYIRFNRSIFVEKIDYFRISLLTDAIFRCTNCYGEERPLFFG